MTDANWTAYRHYLECKAVRQFPDDPIVRQNARLIAGVEREEEWRMQALMAGLKY